MTALRIWTDGVDTVIAEDEHEAAMVWEEHLDASYMAATLGKGQWHMSTKDPITVANASNGGPLTLSQAEWIAREGRSFLCSTEY